MTMQSSLSPSLRSGARLSGRHAETTAGDIRWPVLVRSTTLIA
jgi:hypothetical protein